MSSPDKEVFLIGLGFIGREILDRLLAERYSVTTLGRQQAAAKEFEQIGVKTTLGSLDDHDVTVDQTYLSDIVIHTATANHLPSVKAVIAGIEKRAVTDKGTIFIHSSGASVLDDDSKSASKNEKVYEDDKLQVIDTVPDTTPHQSIDLTIIKARKSIVSKAKMVIVITPAINGYNPKYERLSIQMPTWTRFALKQGYAGYVGEGAAVCGQVHVLDLARAYVVILHYLEQTDAEKVLQNPYFLCENGQEFAWKDVAVEIGKALQSEKRLESAQPKRIPEDQFDQLFGPGTFTTVGNNVRCRANRIRSLDWKPQEKSMFESLVEDEILIIIQEMIEFAGYVSPTS